MFKSRECLAVDATAEEVRAVLVRGNKKKREIEDFVTLPKADPNDDLPSIDILRELKERLAYKSSNAVFVTPMARAVVIPMNREKVAAMRRSQLLESIKWEVEPFTGISGRLALTGVEVESLKSEPGQILEESDEVMVNISVIERNVYRAIKERFKAAGLKLLRIYPPDACFYAPLLGVHDESDRGVLEIGQGYANFAMLRGGEPKVISTLNITTDVILDHLDGKTSPDLEESLRFILRQAPPPHSVAVTGTGALSGRVIAFIGSLSPTGAEPLILERSLGLTAAGQEESPAFATAAGAAIRELSGGSFSYIGITDAAPVAVRLRQNAYLMPLLTTLMLLVLLLAHYQVMKQRERSYKERTESMKAEIQEKKRQNAQALTLQNEVEELSRRVAEASKKKDFAAKEGDRALSILAQLFNKIVACLPPTVGLLEVRQDYANPFRFLLIGEASRLADVGEFAVRMGDGEMRVKVEVRQLGKAGAEKTGGKTASVSGAEKGSKAKGKGKGKDAKEESAKEAPKDSFLGFGGTNIKENGFVMVIEVEGESA